MRLFFLLVLTYVSATRGYAAFATAETPPRVFQNFTPGKGSRFQLSLAKGFSAEMLVYVTESSENQIGVETFFSTKPSGLPLELWQQTRIKPAADSISIVDAFIFSTGFSAPEKMDIRHLHNQGGLEIADFLFSGTAPEKNRVGNENVETPAGTMPAIHYRQSRGNQTIDYWISDQAKPIGLIKLTSAGKQTFQLVLSSLLNNVKRKIDPKKAVPLSKQGKALLNLSGGLGLMP